VQSAGEKNGGPCRIRTCDLVIKSHLSTGCKGLGDNNLQTGENPVTPTVTPKIEKGAILAALRGLSKDELLGLLADVLAAPDTKENIT